MDARKISDNLLLKVTKPSRYMGTEINSTRKEWSSDAVKIALVFPEPYELGMSHLGSHILYSILNREPGIICERAFMPWPDMNETLRSRGIELFSLETRHPLKDFDILGFSLQYELSYTNILSLFACAGIEPLSQRRQSAPFILGGGPCSFNPEPVARFFDAFLIGEAEEALPEFVQIFRQWRRGKNRAKEGLLRELTSLEGVYVPSLFEETLNRETGLIIPKPKHADYKTVRKRVLKKLDINYMPRTPLVPFMQITHDRLAVEIQRGCTKGCRFCQAGMIYRPTRQRGSQEIIDYALKAQAATGYENISLLSLNCADHCSLGDIFSSLCANFRGTPVSLSLPSTRIDGFSEEVMRQMHGMKKTGYTFAPEAGSERLRKAINKPITDSSILSNLEKIFESGWNLVKLYFMIGLPGETEDDIDAIIRLTKEIASTARRVSPRNRVNINISPFVPKPHTPFQWCAQESITDLRRKIECIKSSIAHRCVDVKWHDPRISALEALISRGDRGVADLLLECSRRGASLDAWSESFDFGLWTDSMKKLGMDIERVCRPIDIESELPWDFIDTGVSKVYLKEEFQKSLEGTTTQDCAFGSCNQCGLCTEDIKPVTDGRAETVGQSSLESRIGPAVFAPFIICFTKENCAKLISHLELIKVFERALLRAGIRVKTSQGFHPIPILRFKRALPIGLESAQERLLVRLDHSDLKRDIRNDLNAQMPPGIEITMAYPVREAEIERELSPGISKYAVKFDYEDGMEENIAGFVRDFKNAQSFIIAKKTKKGIRKVDLKDIILRIEHGMDSIIIDLDESSLMNPLVIINEIVAKRVSPEKILFTRKLEEYHYGNRIDNQRNKPGDANCKA